MHVWRRPTMRRVISRARPGAPAAASPRYTAHVLIATLVRMCLAIFLAAGAGACVRVKPYQRENLARRSMVSDQQAGESRFAQHARGSREGADGGSGEAGGGCGCN